MINYINDKIKKSLSNLNKKIKVFHPNTAFIRYFNFIMVLVELFALWYLPMEISFKSHNLERTRTFLVIIWILFLLDILISFNTANEDKGVLIVDRKSIV